MKYHNERHRMEIISMQSTLDEYRELLKKIEKAANLGYTSLDVCELKGGVIKSLTDEGFLIDKKGNFYEIIW